MTNLFRASFGLISAFVGRLEKAGFTAEMVKAVVKRSALATIVVEAIKGELLSEAARVEPTAEASESEVKALDGLTDNEYLVLVTYDPLPSFAKLEQEFDKGNVSDLFDGRPFEKHASCVNADETPGNKIFLVKHFNREIKSEEAIAEMDKQGYRPATHLEMYAFQKANPALQSRFWIIALGSFAVLGDDRCVTVLRGASRERIFDVDWFDDGWGTGCRFLFVRK